MSPNSENAPGERMPGVTPRRPPHVRRRAARTRCRQTRARIPLAPRPPPSPARGHTHTSRKGWYTHRAMLCC
eukprot:6343752-Prymnesium_polylepis.2